MLKNIGIITLGLAVALISVAPALSLADTGLDVSITSPAADSTFEVDQEINFVSAVTGGSGFYSYAWNFGDGTSAGGGDYAKTYSTAGSRTVTLVVTDTGGRQGSANVAVNIVNQTSALTANIIRPANNAQLTTGQATTFEVQAVGGSGFYSYVWDFGDATSAGG